MHVAGENSLPHCSLKKIESERETLPACHRKPIEHSYENPDRLFTLAKHPVFNLSRSNSGEQRAGAGDDAWHVSFRKSRPRFALHESGQRPHAKETGRAGGCRRALGTLQTDRNRGRTPSERADLTARKIDGFTPDTLTKVPHQLKRFSRPCGCIRSSAGPMGTMRVGLISSC